MKERIRNPIKKMLQGLAHWMAYRNEMSNIQLIEADAIFVATDILRANLPDDYTVQREVTKNSLPIVNGYRIDLGIRSKKNQSYECLIEFKLADATNKGYIGDVDKLSMIKKQNKNIDCLVVILYRKRCSYNQPKEFVDTHSGLAKRGVRKDIPKIVPVKVRGVCNSFTSANASKSIKTICIEII